MATERLIVPGGQRVMFEEVALETASESWECAEGRGRRDSEPGHSVSAVKAQEIQVAPSETALAIPSRLQIVMMTDMAKGRAAHSLKTRGSTLSPSGLESRRKEMQRRSKDSMSTVSYMDEPTQRDEVSRLMVQMENTYQLGPTKHFPVITVNHILKDVLTNYLQEEKYDLDLCRQMTKTISEVIKAQVKELMIPRYKLVVIVHIGQLNGQSILIGSRCLWDPKTDSASSYAFRNSSLFALANVYAVYLE